jgi:hypothetical protein
MLGHYITFHSSNSVPFPAARNSRFQELVVLLELGIFLWMLGKALPEAQKSTRKCSSGNCEVLSGDLTSGRNEYMYLLTVVRSLAQEAGKSASLKPEKLLQEARNQFPNISTSGTSTCGSWEISSWCSWRCRAWRSCPAACEPSPPHQGPVTQ